MQKITPHLWFDKEAKEAANFYTSIFSNSKIVNIATIHEVPTPTGDCDIVTLELLGYPFMAINAGPLFKFNPSISFIVNFDPSRDENAMKNLDELWEKLSRGGTALMPLNRYPFSEHYGWIQDKYGLSWQLILSNPNGEERPAIIPSLMFVGAVVGRAEEAINFYMSVFKNSRLGTMASYGSDQEPDKEGNIMFCDFTLNGQWFAAMDSAQEHKFAFNEAISLLIPCETQEQIDYYWDKLSAEPEAEQCGWLKDKYGLSWQVWPTVMGEMMTEGTAEQIAHVTKAFLQMKKFDIALLQRAYEASK
ncbi:VOC family protein [Legionella brunensis]|uniref:DNA binding protein n=2 Tax=Legionella brunensis TaxID=29422 RepID=A0A0W0SDE0_9GAMM|nr:VOC family protein [Legionella brunensis]KTC81496.1 DNA binding protein [Legionella brunensis]